MPFAPELRSSKMVLISLYLLRVVRLWETVRYVNDFRTSASVGAEGLIQNGVPAGRVQVVASHENGRDRTVPIRRRFAQWFHRHNLPIHSFNSLLRMLMAVEAGSFFKWLSAKR